MASASACAPLPGLQRIYFAQPKQHVSEAEPAGYDADAGGVPTQHVRIILKRTSKRVVLPSEDEFRAILSRFGDVRHILYVPSKNVVYATFADAAAAVALCAAAREGSLGLEHTHACVQYYLAFDATPGSLPCTNADFNDAMLHGSIPPGVQSRVVPPIPGLLIVHDFLSEEEERILMEEVDTRPWITNMRRRVQHYGHGFDYISRRVMAASKDTAAPAASAGASAIEVGVAARDAGDRAEASTPAAAAEVEDAVKQRVPSVMDLNGALRALVQRLECLGFCADDGNPALQACTFTAPLAGAPALSSFLEHARTDARAVSEINQVTVNEYTPGQGIGPHVDTHDFQDGVVSVSIAGDVPMEFRYAAKEPHSCGGCRGTGTPGCALCSRAVQVWLPRRSLLMIRGEARYAWAHSIPARHLDHVDGQLRMRQPRRISITCRRIRGSDNPCRCMWSSVCFDQAGGSSEPTVLHSPALRKMREETPLAVAGAICSTRNSAAEPPAVPATSATAPAAAHAPASMTAAKPQKPNRSTIVPADKLDAGHASASVVPPEIERSHVHALYDAIAEHFSHTRHSPWPRVEKFLLELPPASVVFDVGCGNGKYLGVNRSLCCIGSDRAEPLAAICRERGFEAFVADAVALPMRSAAADATLCIAVLHHIASLPRRLSLMRELLRVTRPGGLLFIQAWALEQGEDSRRAFDSQDVFVPWNLSRRFVHGEPDEIVKLGGTINPEKDSVVFQRYCHVYTRGELDHLLLEAAGTTAAGEPGVSILESWWDRDNWALIARKNVTL